MSLKFFDLYVSLGLKPIAIIKNSKRPLDGKGWNKNWSIDKWRPYFEVEHKCNMGILLGEIVDVEGDTEEANELLNNMLFNIPHPAFKSSKSTHHLFQNPDPNLSRKVFNHIEFRGHLHQSVIPPSTHKDGTAYKWLAESIFPIPKMPDQLLDFYFKNCKEIPKAKHRKKHKIGYTKTQCNICQKLYFIHKKRLKLEVKGFLENKTKWSCHGCRPFDLRDYCRFHAR